MGKKRQKAAAAVAQPTVTEQIEQREQAKLLQAAQAKGLRDLTANEKAAVARHEEGIFLRVFASCRKTLATELFGTSSKVITDNRNRRGVPWPLGKRDRVDLRELVQFLWRYFLEHPLPEARPGGLTEEDVLLAGASQDLKDEFLRERIRERRIVNQQKSIELQLLEESHIPTKEVRIILAEAAGLIAKKRESLERILEGEAREVVSRAFEDMAEDINKKGEAIDDGSGDTNH